MSDFDLKLDRFSKVATIMIGIIGLLVSGYVAIFVVWPAHNRDNAKACFETENKILKNIKEYPDGDITTYINQIKDICRVPHEAAEIKIKSLVAIVNALPRTDDPTVSGYVSLGPENKYVDSNFRNFETGEKALKHLDKLKKGTILRARWSVNLRKNLQNTKSGHNPSIAIIDDNECVKMLEDLPDTIRGSYWVNVATAECP